MEWEKFLATALVVGVIGPLFWLGVKVLENRLRLLWGLWQQHWRARQAKKARTPHR
jgi:hypothetical protein